jgi:tellurite resistance protein TerC
VDVSPLQWIITICVTVAVLLFDVVVIARKPHEPSIKECAVALCVYIGAALAFAAYVFATAGRDADGDLYGTQFITGWLVEYSLSIDNLFVFIILMSALKVPRKYQQEALMVGIILALIFRGIFIALGYQLVDNFSWIFYIFGAFLVYTAYGLIKSYRDDDHSDDADDNKVVAFARRRLNVGEEFRGLTLWWK